jgi:hypothetical protein
MLLEKFPRHFGGPQIVRLGGSLFDQPEPQNPGYDQKDRHDVIKQLGDDQDKDARDQGHDGLKMRQAN